MRRVEQCQTVCVGGNAIGRIRGDVGQIRIKSMRIA